MKRQTIQARLIVEFHVQLYLDFVFALCARTLSKTGAPLAVPARYGFVAQELEQVMPELVRSHKDS